MLTKIQSESDHVKSTFEKLSQLWRRRATVNVGPVDHESLDFLKDRPDFADSLLPFRDHPRWKEAPIELKDSVLSYGWAIYNLKTIYVECDIVTPACEDLIKCPVGNTDARFELQRVMSEALLDEALHTKMSITACNYIYKNRGLLPLDFQGFNLVAWRNRLLDEFKSEPERRLARFSIATASETLITDYLKTLADDEIIQPICREVTRSHAIDEWGHSGVFSAAAEHVIAELSCIERNMFAGIVSRTVEMFADNELGAWRKAFEILSFPHHREILDETREVGRVQIYKESVSNLLGKLGLETPQI